MIHGNTNKFIVGMALAAGIAVTVAILTGHVGAQILDSPDSTADAPDKKKATESREKKEGALRVGTYDPQQVFQRHPAQEELMNAMRKAQSQLQEAQEEGDQQKMQEIQQRHEQNQGRIIDKFQQDVARKLPGVAKETKVQVVALEVVYTAEDVRTKNITPQLIEVFSEDDKGQRELRQFPQSP